MPKVYSEVFGCSANQADYGIMLGLLEKSGFSVTSSLEKSDVNVLVTCTVKNPTASKMVNMIKELTKTGKPLVVAGCFAKAERSVVDKFNPSASLVGPDAIDRIVDVVRNAMSGRRSVILDGSAEKSSLPHVRKNPAIDIIEISSGCNSKCSFCETKIARGDLRSYRPYGIREQANNAIGEGCRELWITSQDTSAYGTDIGTSLPELLNSVAAIGGKFFIRVGMMNPLHFRKVELGKLVDSYRNDKVFKFVHLCVQSGSDRVLDDMARGYSVKDFVKYVETLRKGVPGITLETDIIIGFPTESDEDFSMTMKLLEDVEPDAVNISKYGARPNTVAAKMKQIGLKVVSERSRAMHGLVEEIKLAKNKKWVGWEGEVLVDEVGTKKGTWMARNFAYKPMVLESDKNLLGKFVNAKVTAAKGNYLLAELI